MWESYNVFNAVEMFTNAKTVCLIDFLVMNPTCNLSKLTSKSSKKRLTWWIGGVLGRPNIWLETYNDQKNHPISHGPAHQRPWPVPFLTISRFRVCRPWKQGSFEPQNGEPERQSTEWNTMGPIQKFRNTPTTPIVSLKTGQTSEFYKFFCNSSTGDFQGHPTVATRWAIRPWAPESHDAIAIFLKKNESSTKIFQNIYCSTIFNHIYHMHILFMILVPGYMIWILGHSSSNLIQTQFFRHPASHGHSLQWLVSVLLQNMWRSHHDMSHRSASLGRPDGPRAGFPQNLSAWGAVQFHLDQIFGRNWWLIPNSNGHLRKSDNYRFILYYIILYYIILYYTILYYIILYYIILYYIILYYIILYYIILYYFILYYIILYYY